MAKVTLSSITAGSSLVGWECPVCGRVHAPWVGVCTHGTLEQVVTEYSGCMWDSIPPDELGKAYGLSCHCPKCTPQC